MVAQAAAEMAAMAQQEKLRAVLAGLGEVEAVRVIMDATRGKKGNPELQKADRET